MEMPPIRPPSEAASLLIRVTKNCPWNQCAFCSLYRGQKFEIRPVADVKADILEAKEIEQRVIEVAHQHGVDPTDLGARYGLFWIGQPHINAFLGDSNSIIVRADDLAEIIRFLYQSFPNLRRVTSYGRAQTICKKPFADLVKLREAGLSRLHVGLETGDEFLLSWLQKGATADQMVEAGQKVKRAGISLSEYVILGLGGQRWWEQHALGTARVLNTINPDFIRLRTVMVQPGTPLAARTETGEFRIPSPELILREERLLIENLDVTSWLISDHISNYLSINGKFPEAKSEMLEEIDEVLRMIDEDPEGARRRLTAEHRRRI